MMQSIHQKDRRSFNPSVRLGLLLALLGLAAPGCGLLRADSAPAAAEVLELQITLDGSTYRPGEVVRAALRLVSHQDEPCRVWAPNAQSIKFYFGRLGDPERMERLAVASTKEDMNAGVALEAQGAFERAFLLTRLTEFNGPLVLQAHYTPGAGQGMPARIYSNVVNYKVTGPRLFERDPQGYLTRREAIRLATAAALAKAPGKVQQAQTLVIENEWGYYEWQVNVAVVGAAGQSALLSFYVDPYNGVVRGEAKKPFDPALAEDKRFQRPDNLPPLTRQGSPEGPGKTTAPGE